VKEGLYKAVTLFKSEYSQPLLSTEKQLTWNEFLELYLYGGRGCNSLYHLSISLSPPLCLVTEEPL
jgi:hypothetical protein